jgi:FkbM family methyltransferase
MKPFKMLNHSVVIKSLLYRLIWKFSSSRKKSVIWQRLDAMGRDIIFLNIGANDGIAGNPLTEFILTRKWTGVMVEPVPHVFKRLKLAYGSCPRVKLINCAIGTQSGSQDFFFLRKNRVLPPGYDQIGSFDRQQVLKECPHFGSEAESFIESQSVLVKTLAEVAPKNYDVLLVDTEGYDAKIASQVDFKNPPKLIIYEHIHVKNSENESLRALLQSHGYRLEIEEGNTVALR